MNKTAKRGAVPQKRSGTLCEKLHECDIEHDYIMAETSGHNKEMEDLMRAKELMSGIEERKLQCVDHTADSVNNTACQKPSETCPRQIVEDRYKSQDTQPAHSSAQRM